MSLIQSNSLETAITTENLEATKSFIEKRLKRNNISKEVQSETLLVYDALCHSLLRQGFDQDTLITIKTGSSFGELNITLSFEGKPFVALCDEPGCVTEEDRILRKILDSVLDDVTEIMDGCNVVKFCVGIFKHQQYPFSMASSARSLFLPPLAISPAIKSGLALMKAVM